VASESVVAIGISIAEMHYRKIAEDDLSRRQFCKITGSGLD
jgi:hypothetical protein